MGETICGENRPPAIVKVTLINGCLSCLNTLYSGRGGTQKGQVMSKQYHMDPSDAAAGHVVNSTQQVHVYSLLVNGNAWNTLENCA